MTGAPPPRPGHGRMVFINGPHTDWAGRYDVVAGVALAALPVAVLLAWLLARRRQRAGSTRAWAWRSSSCDVGLVYGTLPWVVLTLLPGAGAGVGHDPVSLVPLRDLATMPGYQVLGNLLVFAAFGLLAPLRFGALASVPRVLALAAAGSGLIETTQYLLPLGRVASVDDVILNAAGAGLAALVSRSVREQVDRRTAGRTAPTALRLGRSGR